MGHDDGGDLGLSLMQVVSVPEAVWRSGNRETREGGSGNENKGKQKDENHNKITTQNISIECRV